MDMDRFGQFDRFRPLGGAMVKCPCCDQPMKGTPEVHHLKEIKVTSMQEIILHTLVAIYPKGITGDDLVWQTYQGSNEPDSARSAMNVQINRLRKRLAEYGWTIPNNQTGRGNMKRYSLQPLGER